MSNDYARVPLSALELAPVGSGQSSADALRSTAAVAQRVEQLGYRRFWVAEHHNMPGVASTSPAVLIAHVAAQTSTIRVGSGGVMLPNHAPLVVAEQFAMLEALHPGRVDLGIGRAPGTDQRTALALRRTPEGLNAEDFPRELDDLLTLLERPEPAEQDGLFGAAERQDPHGPTGPTSPPSRTSGLVATPAAESSPAVWLLGSSGYSAQVAGLLGLPFAFAHHFSAKNTIPALELYRSRFRPSAVLDEPYAMVTQSVIVADTYEEAERQALPGRLVQVSLRTGRPRALPSPEEAAAHEWTDLELEILAASPGRPTIGDPASVRAELAELVATTGADELMVTTMTYGVDARLRSFDLLAKAWV
ncbi:LLM class flavin-dependent oxidoreductase [Actinopolymorpha alba]|uniref:LLM class flavin-dependent oxidoreductase n=1 Tax=Actinopolymorpha alba TaxID=533267 RepID=UPI00036C45EB|nr:LLM class flavin-dependent oxidoreductase [Actinopolymorpha alba]